MKKMYIEMDIQLFQWEVEDIVTLSAGEFDNNKENDVTGDDIFGDN